MRVNHLGFVPADCSRRPDRRSDFDRRVDTGEAILVSVGPGNGFPGGRVALQADVHERFVLWPSAAMREHGLYLAEDERLQALLQPAALCTRFDSPSVFHARCRDARSQDAAVQRYTFTLHRFDDCIRTGWLITT